MELCMKWIIIGILFFNVSLASRMYPEYFVEENCINGNETLIFDTAEGGSAGILKTTSHPPYSPNKDCTIVIVPPRNRGIVLSVRKIDMRRNGFDCQDYIKVFHSNGLPTVICRFQFDMEDEITYFSNGPMRIFYHADKQTSNKSTNLAEGFSLTYTVVSKEMRDCLSEDAFLCDNGRCISSDRTCDGQNNCGDRSDEAHAICDNVDVSAFKIGDAAYVIVFCVLVFSAIISCAVVLSRRRQRPEDMESISDQDEPTARLRPYQAVHPTGLSICQNPAGPDSLCPSKLVHAEEGFANPCYPFGFPQNSYSSFNQ